MFPVSGADGDEIDPAIVIVPIGPRGWDTVSVLEKVVRHNKLF
jgi:hypothetical protein